MRSDLEVGRFTLRSIKNSFCAVVSSIIGLPFRWGKIEPKEDFPTFLREDQRLELHKLIKAERPKSR